METHGEVIIDHGVSRKDADRQIETEKESIVVAEL